MLDFLSPTETAMPAATADPPKTAPPKAQDPTLETLETLQGAYAVLRHIRDSGLLYPGLDHIYQKITSVVARSEGVFVGWGVEVSPKIAGEWEQAIPLPPQPKLAVRPAPTPVGIVKPQPARV
jgi:hypothetical protein